MPPIRSSYNYVIYSEQRVQVLDFKSIKSICYSLRIIDMISNSSEIHLECSMKPKVYKYGLDLD